MYKIYGDILSGNCYKIKLLLQFLNIEHQWTPIDILAGQTHTAEFITINPNERIPAMEIGEGIYLWESNAILHYLADGSSFLPTEKLERAKVLQWQFFEQHSHEPYIATARYINKYLGLPEEQKAEYLSKQDGGHKALRVMDRHLKATKFFLGEQPTIADISLYAYTHVAHEGGFELGEYEHVLRWLEDFESIPGYVTMDVKNA